MTDVADCISNICSPLHSHLSNIVHPKICPVKNTSSSASLEARGKCVALFLSRRWKLRSPRKSWLPCYICHPSCFPSISFLFPPRNEDTMFGGAVITPRVIMR